MRRIALALIACFVCGSAQAHHSGLPWCGIYLGQYLHKTERRLWMAREWASEGSNAGGPCVGCVVVWRHHVGLIEAEQYGQWIVRSGNDGGRVRVRPRSLQGAIAFRRL